MKTETPPSGDRPPSSEPIDIEISDTQSRLRIDRGLLAPLARRVLAGEGIERASVSLALVDNATIHALNRRHLGHDWPTDVITFRLSDEGDPVLSGELIVSAEMAATTARESGADPWAELSLYVVHGLLHLCGYDDQSAEDTGRMRRRESEILAGEGLTNTFALVGTVERDDRAEGESARWS
jgi:probable rRNA maturation factor